MADNVTLPGTGTVVESVDVGAGVERQVVTLGRRSSATGDVIRAEDEASGDGHLGIPMLAVRKVTPANTSGADGDYEFPQIFGGRLWASANVDAIGGVAPSISNGAVDSGTLRVTLANDSTGVVTARGAGVTVTVDVQRPANTTQYATGDTWSDSTSAPTSGGYTVTSAARASGGQTLLASAVVTSSNPATIPLQGEIWLFDTSVTNVNDNSPFVVSDSEVKTLVGKIPFNLETAGNNSSVSIPGLAMLITTSGSANLRFMVRVANDYQPISAETLTVRLIFAYQT